MKAQPDSIFYAAEFISLSSTAKSPSMLQAHIGEIADNEAVTRFTSSW